MGPGGALNPDSKEEGAEEEWIDPVGQKLTVQLVLTRDILILQPWDPLECRTANKRQDPSDHMGQKCLFQEAGAKLVRNEIVSNEEGDENPPTNEKVVDWISKQRMLSDVDRSYLSTAIR